MTEVQGTKNKVGIDDISPMEMLISLKRLCRYLLGKWLSILIFGIVGAVLGYVIAYNKKPEFNAVTTFVIESGRSAGGLEQYSGLASLTGIDLGGGSGSGMFQGDNILELYKSRKMIQMTLLTPISINDNKVLLLDRYFTFKNLKENWKDKPNLLRFVDGTLDTNTVHGLRLRDSVLNVIVKDIRQNYLYVSKPDKKLNIIEAKVIAEDELFAKHFNDEIVRNVNNFYVDTKTKKAVDNVKILERKTDSVRAVMNGSIFSAARISDATPNLNPTRQTQRLAPLQQSQMNIEASKAMLTELVKNLELSRLSLLREEPFIAVIDQPLYPLEATRFSKIKYALIGLVLCAAVAIFYLLASKFFSALMKSR